MGGNFNFKIRINDLNISTSIEEDVIYEDKVRKLLSISVISKYNDVSKYNRIRNY